MINGTGACSTQVEVLCNYDCPKFYCYMEGLV